MKTPFCPIYNNCMAKPTNTGSKDNEYQYYTRKLAAASITVPANMHLTELRKILHASVVGSSNVRETASDLEWRWLGTFTGVTGKTLRDRWEQAFVSLGTGIKPPATLQELQYMFYQLAP